MTGDTASTAAREGTPPAPPVLTSAELLRGGREIAILHDGETYRLRVTSRGRLILTK
jgi:hemin uptake protein HemP